MREPVRLDGHSLTAAQIAAVARENAPVELSPQAMETVRLARETVLRLAGQQRPVYGLNTGLGANKDNQITPAEYQDFNVRILRSHSVALPPIAQRDAVRAAILCRLNSFLIGTAGVDPQIPYLLCEMLNRGIHPLVPERGSVGMADLGNMAYLSLPLIGEGRVECGGEILPVAEALRRNGLSPVQLGVKEGLPLVSSNAFSVARAALLSQDTADLLCMADAVFALGFEAQGYNPMFLDMRSIPARPLPGHRRSLSYVNACLKGSRLWDSPSESLAAAGVGLYSEYFLAGQVSGLLGMPSNLLAPIVSVIVFVGVSALTPPPSEKQLEVIAGSGTVKNYAQISLQISELNAVSQQGRPGQRQNPGVSCSSTSCYPTGFRTHDAAERRPA